MFVNRINGKLKAKIKADAAWMYSDRDLQKHYEIM